MSHHLDINTVNRFATFPSDMFLWVGLQRESQRYRRKGERGWKRRYFFLSTPPSLISTIYFEIVSGLQKSYKNSIKNSKMPFTQIPPILTFLSHLLPPVSHMYIFFLHHLMTHCKLMASKKYLHIFPKNNTSFIDTYTRLNKIRKLTVIYCITQSTEFHQLSPYCSFSKRRKKF